MTYIVGTKSKKNVGTIITRSGASFRVWAPFADKVSVIGSFNNWVPTNLESEQDGYWFVFINGVIPGQEYKFLISNGDDTLIRNDPRALHFTTSAGTSVVSNNKPIIEDNYDRIAIEQQIIYEVHVGTFSRKDPAINGSFSDLIGKLDYIKDLGVNMIELMPINSMLMDRGWGYAIDYIFAVESLYGGNYGLKQLIIEAHSRGIGIILDVVYNHFGPDSNLDLWNFDGWHKEGYGGVYFYNDWRAETPWGLTRPDFGRLEVIQYILDNVKMWTHDFHIDGLRVDSTIYIRNVKGFNNDPEHDLAEGWYLLQKINSLAKKINPSIITIAEDVAGNEHIIKDLSEGGAGFSTQWDLSFPRALKDALKTNDPLKVDIRAVTELLTKQFNGYALGRVIYSDSHDSAANGSARMVEVISPGKPDSLFARQQSLIAATLIMTAPGIPMLFQGQEIMQGGSFNDWQGLDWTKVNKHLGIIEAYKHLINLRKNTHHVSGGLVGGNIKIIQSDNDNKILVYHRWKDGGVGDDVVVIINFTKLSHDNYIVKLPRDGLWQLRFNSTWDGYSKDFINIDPGPVLVSNGAATIKIPSSSALIFSQDN